MEQAGCAPRRQKGLSLGEFLAAHRDRSIDIPTPTCIRPNANDAELMMVKKWSKPAVPPAGKKGYPWANFSQPIGSYPNYGFAGGTWQYFWFSPPAAPAPTW